MAKKKITVPEDSTAKDAANTTDFKQSLVDTLQESNTARAEMKSVLHELLKQADTKTEIENIIKETDRKAIQLFWKKFGFATWSAMIFTAGVIITAIVEKIVGR